MAKRTRNTTVSGFSASGANKTASDGNLWLTVRGATQNNLKGVDVSIPLGRFVCVTGVSGSGKSSLVNDILREQLSFDLNGAVNVSPGAHEAIEGKEHLDKIVDIDQSPIGRTPRSNPGTYIKVFDLIRDLYAKLPDAKVRGYKPGRFSFNVPTGDKGGGRCEACEGNGANKIEMDFLADIWAPCPVCRGRRFNRETLQILFKGKSIADVLEMDVGDAVSHFENVPKVAHMLRTLHDVGMDYIKLGQSSTTLSGGEAQRVKLAKELVKRSTGRTLYLLDEPTTGLHFEDIRRLLGVLHGFVDVGNSVVVIEHNMDVIKTADWVIDLGPEGGADGGRILAEGTPEEVAGVRGSYTGESLAQVLGIRRRKSAVKTKSSSKGSGKTSGLGRRFDSIDVVGARQHNLKGIDVSIPRGVCNVFCGPSGSGKTSLAIDTIYAEGQRRYVESLSAYARQFLGQAPKPRVDHVYGLSPAIAIEQKSASRTPRSTVGTVTEIYDYMRVLWARIGAPHCPDCGVPTGAQTSDEIVERIVGLGDGVKALILAPVERGAHETWAELFERERANGYSRVRVDGAVYALEGAPELGSRGRHDVELVVDRVIVNGRRRSRLGDSVEQALALGRGAMKALVVDDDGEAIGKALRFSQVNACSECGRSFEEMTPHHFSFNARMGWCEACEGLGVQKGASPAAIVRHPNRSILDGALAGFDGARGNAAQAAMLRGLARHVGFDSESAWREMSESQQLAVLQGTGGKWIDPVFEDDVAPSWRGLRFRWNGFFPAIDRATRTSWAFRKRLEELVTDVPCEGCGGSRLREISRWVTVAGRRMEEVCQMPLVEAQGFFGGLKLGARERRIAGELLHEITSRLRFLVDVGLDYLSLHRAAPTLSGGETQRIRLASQIGSGLTGVLYVLDEPTIGLHPRDNGRLVKALHRLRDLGNTLIVVEHDREVIDSADQVLDFGPGSGTEGGWVTAQATPKGLRRKRASLTGRYLAGKEAISVPTNRREVSGDVTSWAPERTLVVSGARHHNLREIDVSFPLGRFIAVTGVSGSGKSSLVSATLHPALATRIHRARMAAGGHDRIVGAEYIDKVINVDQSPIGNSPASNPATYTGVFDTIRELYAKLPEAKMRGYSANRFSFNREGGRCEACVGLGQQLIEMHFLPDVWIPCEHCNGARYVPETLEVQFKGRSIADVLESRVSEAVKLFESTPKICRMLETLEDVGLGYVQLGQSAPTLSGGEAQRVKLAAELGRPQTGKTLYILDEPTTGLHFDDLKKLLKVLHRLVDLGNTVVCVEHNLDLIKTADWVIEMGPEAGVDGGTVVVAGTPETVAAFAGSHTGAALKPVLEAGPHVAREVYDTGRQKAIEKEISKPFKLEQAGVSAKMPWEVDGRKWHTRQRVDRRGRKIQWDSGVLEWLVETIEGLGDFDATDWRDRARVEIRASGTQSAMWFAHFRTGGRDLLDLSIRVPARHFDNKTVVRALNVSTLDGREDLPIYGQGSRVKLRAAGREYDDIRILLHDFKDVDKKNFESFLKKAVDAYLHMAKDYTSDPVKGQPWKADGKKWHLSQKSINAKHTIEWKPQLILEFVGRLSKLAPDIALDWNGKVGIGMRRGAPAMNIGKIVTNRGFGLRIDFAVHRNRFTPLMVNRLGFDVRVRSFANKDRVEFCVKTLDENDISQLRSVLSATIDQPVGTDDSSRRREDVA